MVKGRENLDFESKNMSLGFEERSNCVTGTAASLKSELKSPHMTSDLFDDLTLCINFDRDVQAEPYCRLDIEFR